MGMTPHLSIEHKLYVIDIASIVILEFGSIQQCHQRLLNLANVEDTPFLLINV